MLPQVSVVADALTMTGSIHDLPIVPECDLNKQLGELMTSGSLSDVTLVIGEREFKSHKAILAGMLEYLHVCVLSVCENPHFNNQLYNDCGFSVCSPLSRIQCYVSTFYGREFEGMVLELQSTSQ